MTKKKERNQHPPTAPNDNRIRIPIRDINVEEQAIRDSDDLDHVHELMNSIATHGLLQSIVVQHIDNGYYLLVAGKHRLEACRRLGWVSIPAHIRAKDQHHVKELALVENVMRKDISTEEECRVVQWMHDDQKKSPSQIADALSRSRGWVDRRLGAAQMSQAVKDALFSGQISFGMAELIEGVPDESFRNQLLNGVIYGEYKTEEVARMVAAIKEPGFTAQAEMDQLPPPPAQPASGAQTRACDGCQAIQEYHRLGVLWCCEQCRFSFHETMKELARIAEVERVEATGNPMGEQN